MQWWIHVDKVFKNCSLCMSKGVVMAKVGLIAAPDCPELLPSASHARLQIRRPEHRMQQHAAITCATRQRSVIRAAAACLEQVSADSYDLQLYPLQNHYPYSAMSH